MLSDVFGGVGLDGVDMKVREESSVCVCDKMVMSGLLKKKKNENCGQRGLEQRKNRFECSTQGVIEKTRLCHLPGDQVAI